MNDIYELHTPVPFAIPPVKRARPRRLAFAAAAIAVCAGLAALAVRRAQVDPSAGASPGIVRVVLPSESGTGFFVAGPDELAYAVTALHVVDSGERIAVEHTVDVPGGEPYVESFPDVELVASDADMDLAVLRLNHVRATRFTQLPLATEPHKDEPIQSYGYPSSSLSRATSMMSKPGKVLELVKFPAYDEQTHAVVREDAVEGLLISAEIEPGFSGGPTCNDRGEVVGVNVTKDLVHRGQNGAISVVALRRLLDRVKPAAQAVAPTPAEVRALVARVQTELLQLPLERRPEARIQDYVSLSDLPRVRELIAELRALEHDPSRDPKTKLAGAALLGIVVARLPGEPLETYMASTTHQALEACELRRRGLQAFFGPITRGDGAPIANQDCAALAIRPLVWDLAALALQWEGKVREATVVKVESVDDEHHLYRASLRFADGQHLVEVWVSTEGGVARLKLFDSRGMPPGLSTAGTVAASSYEGTWHRTEPRTARATDGGEVDVASDETLVLSVAATGAVFATHDLHRHMYRETGPLPCGNGSRLELGLEQTFAGQLDNGTIVAFRHTEPKALGADMAACWRALTYAPDAAVVFKLVGDALMMYRTDGTAFPEAAEFHR